jgi:23S rRNA (cytosine1962-C5)-methyltransferase
MDLQQRSELDSGVEDGAIVDILTGRGKFLGKAYYNSRSQIVARILTRKKEEIDEAFFKEDRVYLAI